jgi:class 3 adenylate cyclase/pimeloyl-ACP methyl ester carboxylesterase
MKPLPETRYAKGARGYNIAYQVAGDGDVDLVFVPGFVSHVELAWEWPHLARFVQRLSSFSRLILFDKRGTGLSDRVPASEVPTHEERMDDVRAVMDAAGSERAAVFGVSEGGPMCVLFAATYPERVSHLVLYGTQMRFTAAEDHDWLPPDEDLEELAAYTEQEWGSGPLLDVFAPSMVGDEAFEQWWARALRNAASPAAAAAVLRMIGDTDARHVLPSVRVPTLIMQRENDLLVPVLSARYIAERIPGANYVELPGEDHLPWVGDIDALLNGVEEFVTGTRHVHEPDRMLATVMFTDVVDSTARAAAMGDRDWRELIERHDQLMRLELERYRGREVKTMGDGFLATFDGPARAIRCATSARDAVRTLGIDIRAGLHTGECEVMGNDVGGIAVSIGARVSAAAGPGEVLVSRTVTDLVAGSGIAFTDRGAHVLKGVPGEWQLYAVCNERAPKARST